LPLHAMYYQIATLAKRWDLSDEWVVRVVRMVDEHNKRFPATPVEFWDFADYSTFAMEAVPPIGQTVTDMHWFWDAVHFKKALGDLVIDRLTGFVPPASINLDNFGVMLTPENVHEFLSRVRREHAAMTDDFSR
jgi:hypothetical protein